MRQPLIAGVDYIHHCEQTRCSIKQPEHRMKIPDMDVALLRRLMAIVMLGIPLSMCVSSIAAGAERVPRIGMLWPGDVDLWTKAFLEGLRQNGYINGTTAIIDIRDTGSNFASGRKLAEELVAQQPDVIFASPSRSR
jgi:ABC-type sugar transport system substrate-binding protein